MGLMCYFIAARRRVFAVFVTHSPVKWFFFGGRRMRNGLLKYL